MKVPLVECSLERKELFYMNIEKLKQDLAAKPSSNKTEFKDVIVVFTGAPVTKYYDKLRDANGNVVKDSKGKSTKGTKLLGYTYTFSELGTSKMVKVVHSQGNLDLTLLNVYKASGMGYDLRNANMIFIDERGGLKNYV